jgi:hypothetical protein
MNNSDEAKEPDLRSADVNDRELYEKPAIIYEGKITVRAGSPNDFTGNPFNPFGGSNPPDVA